MKLTRYQPLAVRSEARQLSRGLIIAALGLSISACSVVPEALKPAELEEPVKQAAGPMTANQAPVTGAIDVNEAIARALLYNLDFKVEAADRAQRLQTTKLSEYAMWPQLLADAGYDVRDKVSASSSFNVTTGTQNFAASTSTNRDIQSANLGLSWNVLDFGLSYIRAQQNADRVLIAREEERKVVNRMVQDVRALYWRALSAQKQLPRLRALLKDVDIAIEQSNELLDKKLAQNPLDPLTYQRELLDIKRRAEGLIQELRPAKIQLAALINLKPGTPFSLQDAEEELPSTSLDLSVSQLEEIALRSRPEMRTLSLEKRITAKEGRAQLLELLPGLKLFAGKHYSSNSFLLHQDWLDAGVQVSWNVFNVFRYGQTETTIESRKNLLQAQQLSLAMAILTQVNVALARYGSSEQRFHTADRYAVIQSEISRKTETLYKTSQGSRHVRLREQINALVADIERDIAFADYQNAYAGVVASIGVDPLPESLDGVGLDALKSKVEKHWTQLLGGELAKAYGYEPAEASVAYHSNGLNLDLPDGAVDLADSARDGDLSGEDETAALAPADIIAIDSELDALASTQAASIEVDPSTPVEVIDQPLAEQGIVVDLTPTQLGSQDQGLGLANTGVVGGDDKHSSSVRVNGEGDASIPWTVQIASLGEEAKAEQLLRRLKDLGIDGARIEETQNRLDGSVIYVVQVSYLGREDAEALKAKIEQGLGVTSWVRLTRI